MQMNYPDLLFYQDSTLSLKQLVSSSSRFYRCYIFKVLRHFNLYIRLYSDSLIIIGKGDCKGYRNADGAVIGT